MAALTTRRAKGRSRRRRRRGGLNPACGSGSHNVLINSVTEIRAPLAASALAGASVNRAAEIVSLLIAGFAVAFLGWAVVHLSPAPIHKDDQRPTASRLRRWLEAAYSRSQKVPE